MAIRAAFVRIRSRRALVAAAATAVVTLTLVAGGFQAPDGPRTRSQTTAADEDTGTGTQLVTVTGAGATSDPRAGRDPFASPAGGSPGYDRAGDSDGTASADPPNPVGEPSGLPVTTGTPATRASAAPRTAPGRVTGTVVRAWADHSVGSPGQVVLAAADAHPPGAHAHEVAWLDTGAKRYRIAGEVPPELVPDATASLVLGLGDEVSGYPVGEVVAIEAPEPDVVDGLVLGGGESLPFGAVPAAITHDVTVVLVQPTGTARDGTTLAAMNTAVSQADAYWSAQTGGQRGFRVAAAHDWLTTSAGCADPTAMWNEVASRVGFTSGSRRHLMLYVTRGAAGCSAGLGTVGSGPDAGGRSYVQYASADVVAHELGHNLSLGHSEELLCQGSSDSAWSGSWATPCSVRAYGDWYDVMGIGWGVTGMLNAAHAERLGVLSSADRAVVRSSAVVRLSPLAGAGLRVLRVDDPAGAYFVEYRTAAGGDAWIGQSRNTGWNNLRPGVLVRRANPSLSRNTLLLDASPGPVDRNSDWDAPIGVGGSVTTASGRTRVSVVQADSGGATIEVMVDGVPPTTAGPGGDAIALSGPAGITVDRGSVLFTGVASAPGGTVLWTVSSGSTVRDSGWATAGGDGLYGPFSFASSLSPGTYTVTARIPDESSGEGPGFARPGFSDSVTVTVR